MEISTAKGANIKQEGGYLGFSTEKARHHPVRIYISVQWNMS
jgi:hypothetical protein